MKLEDIAQLHNLTGAYIQADRQVIDATKVGKSGGNLPTIASAYDQSDAATMPEIIELRARLKKKMQAAYCEYRKELKELIEEKVKNNG